MSSVEAELLQSRPPRLAAARLLAGLALLALAFPATAQNAAPRGSPTASSPTVAPQSQQAPSRGSPAQRPAQKPLPPAMRVQPPAPPVQPVNSYAGLWIDHTGDGAIELAPCAKAPDQLCGTIVWLKSTTDAAGQPLRDGYNEDERLRRRPICGLPVIGGLRRQPAGSYDEGWIYDPRQGKSFDLELTLKAADRLQVTGYKGVKFLSRTFVWTRAAGPLARCGAVQARTL